MKKIKFYDSICFRGELEILIFRLNELDPYVDGFIIANLNQDDINWDLLKKWESKIHIISTPEENCFELIKDKFIKLNPMFEDVLMVSNTNEVPNLRDKEPFFEKLRFEYFIIEHCNFIWNYEYVDVEPSRGTIVTNLSLIVQTKNAMDTMDELHNFQDYINRNAKGSWKVIQLEGKYYVQCLFCPSILAVKYDHKDKNQPRTGNCNDHYIKKNYVHGRRNKAAGPSPRKISSTGMQQVMVK